MMKLNRTWLHEEFVDLSAYSDQEYIERLTAFGHKIRGFERIRDENSGEWDTVVDFEIPENRPDCRSVLGLALESAAAFGMTMQHHEPVVLGNENSSIYEQLDAEVFAEDRCFRFTARMVENVRLAPSPMWLQRRLTANGIPPVNNIVDIANYVQLEYGQPLFVFDRRYIESGLLVVREAMEGEQLTTPDGILRDLEPGMLVIADGMRPITLAGNRGGEDTQVREDTTALVFHAASFDESYVRHSDPMLTLPAVQRACELVEMLRAGEVADGIIDILNYVPPIRELPLEADQINLLLGTNISEADMIRYLERLELPVVDGMIQVPSRRPDLTRTADIAREIGRSRNCIRD